MDLMKYIVLDNHDLHIFPAGWSHDKYLRLIATRGQVCTGAGFIRRTGTGLECQGESESIGIRCCSNDNILLKIYLDID